jgi:hypothetical protein
MANFTQRTDGKWQANIRRSGWPDQSKTFQTLATQECVVLATFLRAEPTSMSRASTHFL